MDSLFDFISSTGGKITGAIVAFIIVVIIISSIDRHPSGKDGQDTKNGEDSRDDS